MKDSLEWHISWLEARFGHADFLCLNKKWREFAFKAGSDEMAIDYNIRHPASSNVQFKVDCCNLFKRHFDTKYRRLKKEEKQQLFREVATELCALLSG